jgi:hypothetical protein
LQSIRNVIHITQKIYVKYHWDNTKVWNHKKEICYLFVLDISLQRTSSMTEMERVEKLSISRCSTDLNESNLV